MGRKSGILGFKRGYRGEGERSVGLALMNVCFKIENWIYWGRGEA